MITGWHTFGLFQLRGKRFVESVLEPGGDVYVIGKAYCILFPCKAHSWLATNGDDFIKVSENWSPDSWPPLRGSWSWVVNGPPTIAGFLIGDEDRDFIRSEVKKWLDKWWRDG